jgi:MFS family permease
LNGIFAWLTAATAEQKRTLLGASLGWMLDSMDVMLYALVLGQVQRDLHLSAAISGAMMSMTLLSAAAGGIAFGWFADRAGRVRALSASILIYSVATFFCGLTHTAVALLTCRIILGLGMGGEWAAGAALVAETWPAEHRGKALALVQSSWAVGYALGAALVAVIMPRFGWRAVFFAGTLPALVALWVQSRLHEPAAWRQQHTTRPQWGHLFYGRLGWNTLVCATMNAASLFAWWGLFTWVPRFLSLPLSQGGRGLGIVMTSGWTIVMQAGAFLGYVTFGYIADRFSHKYTYIAYLLVAACLLPVFAFVGNPDALLIIGPLIGFFGTGYFSGFAVIASELFPTALRASAMGFVYNIGRILSAVSPWLIGRVSESAGLGFALSLTSAGFLLAALIATALRIPRADPSPDPA